MKKIRKKKSSKMTKEKIFKLGRKTAKKFRIIAKKEVSVGDINPSKEKVLALVVATIFIATGVALSVFIKLNDVAELPDKTSKNPALEMEIRKMVHGYPIEKMSKEISDQNPKTAAFLVAIAKKESNWGESVPVRNGKDCYNYWGFRLKTDLMGSDDHTCFKTPGQAVNAVAKRIDEIIREDKVDSSRDMIVWKCGSDCESAGGQEAADKWISDVGFYYNKFSDYL